MEVWRRLLARGLATATAFAAAGASHAQLEPLVPRLRVLDLNRDGASGMLPEPQGRWFTPTPYGACFVAATADAYRQVWRTDGTSAGTRPVSELAADPLSQTTPLLLAASDGSGVCYDLLYRSDGLVRMRRIPPPPPSDASGPVSLVREFVSTTSPELVCATSQVLYYTVSADPGEVLLWRTDGTDAGTWLVRAFSTDSEDGYPVIDQIVLLKNRLLFTFNNHQDGRELWSSTGQPNGAGTVLLADIAPGPAGSEISGLTVAGGYAYFAAGTPNLGIEPWVTDGTEEGTHLLKDIGDPAQPAVGSDPAGFVPLLVPDGSGGSALRVFFAASSADAGREPWCTDGTEAGTHRLADIAPGLSSSLVDEFRPVMLGDRLYLSATDGVHGEELWSIDLRTETAAMVRDLAPGPASSSPLWLSAAGATLFFESRVDAQGGLGGDGSFRVFAYRPDSDTLNLACDDPAAEAPYSTWPHGLLSTRSGVLFPAFRSQAGAELFGLDSENPAALPSLIKDLHPGTLGSNPAAFVDTGDLMLFSAQDSEVGREPWYFDPVVEQADRLLDIAPGPTTSAPVEFIAGDGLAIFLARPDPAEVEYEWFVNDGSGTRPLGLTGSPNFASQGVWLADRVVFVAADAVSGFNGRVYRLSRSAPGPELVRDLSSEGGVSPAGFTRYSAAGGVPRALFYASGRTQLWSTDGTEDGTWLVHTFTGAISTSRMGVDHAARLVYFIAGDEEVGAELWVTDGNPDGSGGTHLVSDIRPGQASGAAGGVVVAGGRAYFSGFDAATGFELWTSDGTEQGTRLVKDLWPGASSGFPGSLSASGGKVYFIAPMSNDGPRLWTSDGTESGTVVIPTPGAPAGYTPSSIRLAARGLVYFTLSAQRQSSVAVDLWATDGTAIGTGPVITRTGRVLTSGQLPTLSGQFKLVRSRIYLPVLDATMGLEPAIIDLCPADLNNSGATDVGDIFQFLQFWTVANQPAPVPGLGPAVDFNADGDVTLDDFFRFIEEFFGGCR